eukprot:CAMPEP_0170520324 /NCGR_PEP_ID=MMETSP0209-20121228/5591_1 /TAXON_ID=665100 ORGANISM="Litonotus pictus, Strain P1" /NCGR_SAMPLE_ID=MMETSP0209 /ASSEMBLY_ACC=CAM_ASM_000301 /LENGTH=285 /DNA_ID=CAMNT_0010806547 /DNA_START=51 /DNA_END=908 /DNA_ORIENTATION=+
MTLQSLADKGGKDGWCVFSEVIGWIYFAAWSSSFYGQVYENWKNKSVKGLSFDFQVLNFTGFLGYSIYNVWGYTDSGIGVDGVKIQDVLFSCHALLLTGVTVGQVIFYYDKNDPDQKVTQTAISITVCIWWGFFIIILIEQILKMYDPYDHKGKTFAFNSIIYLGFMKAIVSLIKYMPQVRMNYVRKSTKGWSIFNIIMDLAGGLFSLVQNLIDTIFECGTVISHNETFLLNIVKYAISVIAIFFDIIFIIQHYCLYKQSPEEAKMDKLINKEDDSGQSPGEGEY